MNWLTNFIRPKIKALVRKTDVPENLWDKCPACTKMVFHRDLEANKRVCPHCGHHMRLRARRRLELLFDDGTYTRIELPKTPVDPLRFRDSKKYTDRLKAARDKTGESDAIVVAHARSAACRRSSRRSISTSSAARWASPSAKAWSPRPSSPCCSKHR